MRFNRGHLIPIDPSIYFIDHLPGADHHSTRWRLSRRSVVIATLAPLYPKLQALGRAGDRDPVRMNGVLTAKAIRRVFAGAMDKCRDLRGVDVESAARRVRRDRRGRRVREEHPAASLGALDGPTAATFGWTGRAMPTSTHAARQNSGTESWGLCFSFIIYCASSRHWKTS